MNGLVNENLHLQLMQEFEVDYFKDKDKTIVDLITVMGSVYCVDVSVTARKTHLSIEIPVFHVEVWQGLTNRLRLLLKWVSGEDYQISFKPFNKDLIARKERQMKLSLYGPNQRIVSLFSGGLDSLTGAYYNFKNDISSDYIGFLNKREEATKQRFLADFYKKKLNPTPDIILIEKPVDKKQHYTQATRSLLYFSLAVAKAYYNQSNQVNLYENGVLTLNPNLYDRFTTKTTHPKTLFEYNNLLEDLNINVQVKHPLLFKTKGESINEMNLDFKGVIKDSFTCGAGRSDVLKVHVGQCGVCIPCLLRKISMAAYDNEQYDCLYYFDYEEQNFEPDVYYYEFISNVQYFQKYVQLIRNNEIFSELNIKSKYYDEADYLVKTNEMLNKFAKEFERYMEKYDLHRYARAY
ncbi:hypothetical protein ACM1TL_13170 [Lysinibacillus capsici]|uniref:hypothetical protein n=1 Tax=Lysinibacillus TaxID=400634 RepID=UPI0021621F24|nr:hypothetical protein [Lysinibacillus boronitolerans]MCS1393282.1 hypothetical protein [Lysinibacillus boronitolerans]UNT56499.1 hypothetical protein ICJ70_05385 [Lysinibacillus capsici]